MWRLKRVLYTGHRAVMYSDAAQSLLLLTYEEMNRQSDTIAEGQLKVHLLLQCTSRATTQQPYLSTSPSTGISQTTYWLVSLTPSSSLSNNQRRSITGDSVTQNHSRNSVSLPFAPPESQMLLPAVNYLCKYTPSTLHLRIKEWDHVFFHSFSIML